MVRCFAASIMRVTFTKDYLFFGSEVELTKKIFGRLTATDMELIYRREIVNGYGIDRLTKRLDATAGSQQLGCRACSVLKHLAELAPSASRTRLGCKAISRTT
jgi:hypothetical protein